MNVTRILPDLQSALLCEDVRQEANGNFILLGIAAFLRVPQVPITANRLCVFTRWCAGVGNFTETVRVIGPTTRPRNGGSTGTRPLLGFRVKMPFQAAGKRTEPPMSVPRCSGP